MSELNTDKKIAKNATNKVPMLTKNNYAAWKTKV